MSLMICSLCCSWLRIDHFLNLIFLPFEFLIVKVVDSGWYLLSLSKFWNHVKEEAPSPCLLMRFFIIELNLIRVTKIRLCVGQTLNSLAQLLLMMLCSFFEHLFYVFIVQDLLVFQLEIFLRLIFLLTCKRRLVIFKVWTEVTAIYWRLNLFFEIFYLKKEWRWKHIAFWSLMWTFSDSVSSKHFSQTFGDAWILKLFILFYWCF